MTCHLADIADSLSHSSRRGGRWHPSPPWEGRARYRWIAPWPWTPRRFHLTAAAAHIDDNGPTEPHPLPIGWVGPSVSPRWLYPRFPIDFWPACSTWISWIIRAFVTICRLWVQFAKFLRIGFDFYRADSYELFIVKKRNSCRLDVSYLASTGLALGDCCSDCLGNRL